MPRVDWCLQFWAGPSLLLCLLMVFASQASHAQPSAAAIGETTFNPVAQSTPGAAHGRLPSLSACSPLAERSGLRIEACAAQAANAASSSGGVHRLDLKGSPSALRTLELRAGHQLRAGAMYQAIDLTSELGLRYDLTPLRLELLRNVATAGLVAGAQITDRASVSWQRSGSSPAGFSLPGTLEIGAQSLTRAAADEARQTAAALANLFHRPDVADPGWFVAASWPWLSLQVTAAQPTDRADRQPLGWAASLRAPSALAELGTLHLERQMTTGSQEALSVTWCPVDHAGTFGLHSVTLELPDRNTARPLQVSSAFSHKHRGNGTLSASTGLSLAMAHAQEGSPDLSIRASARVQW